MPQCAKCGSPAMGRICQNCIRKMGKGAATKATKESKRPCPRPLLTGAKGRDEKFRALGIS